MPTGTPQRYVRWDNPKAAELHQAVCSYALSEVVGAFRKELDALGRQDIRIGMGSWGTDYIPALSVFLPEEVTIMPLDASCMERYRGGSFFDVPGPLAELEQARLSLSPSFQALVRASTSTVRSAAESSPLSIVAPAER